MVMGSDGGSMTRDFIEVVDYAVQLKCADSNSKLKGYPNDKTDVDVLEHSKMKYDVEGLQEQHLHRFPHCPN